MITILFCQDITFVVFSLSSDNQYSIHNATPLVIPADRYTFRVTLMHSAQTIPHDMIASKRIIIISSPAFLSDTHVNYPTLKDGAWMFLVTSVWVADSHPCTSELYREVRNLCSIFRAAFRSECNVAPQQLHRYHNPCRLGLWI